jgi:hypothetical protein
MPELNAMSNYPAGFRTGLSVRGAPILNTYGGQVFWVDSGGPGADNGNGTYQRPFKTIDYAIGKCTASNGDVIICKAGHAETLTSAGAITCDVAGVTIMAASGAVGSLKPALTFSSTDNSASVLVTAAQVSIIGILGICNDDALTNPFHIQAADCFLDIEWRDGSDAIEAATVVLTTAAADRLTVNLRYLGYTTGNACVAPIKLVGCNGGRIFVDFYGLASTAVVNFASTACSDIEIEGYFYNESAALTKNVVDTITGSTWFVKGYDGKGGYSFSGGSAAAVAVDDISTVATYASTASSQAASVGIQTSAVASQTASVGVQASTVQSKTDSVGLTASTTNSKTDSVGLTGSTNISKVDSVGISSSTGISKIDSAGLTGSTNVSKTDSVGINTSTIISTLASIAARISMIASKEGL